MMDNQTYSSANVDKYTCQDHFVTARLETFFRTVVTLLSSVDSKTVLSLGCGEGLDLKHMLDLSWPGADNYYGLDFSPKVLQQSLTTLNTIPFRVVCGDVAHLPLKLDDFDLILCLELLEHVRNPSRVIEEIFNQFRGYCIFSVPNEPFYRLTRMLRFRQNIMHFGNHPDHINHWSASSFRRTLEKHTTVLKVAKSFPWTIVLCRGNEK
jgi:SAM-dependent methyltransferase